MVFTTENSISDLTADPITNPAVFCTPDQVISMSEIELTAYKLNEIFINEFRDEEEKYINNKIFR